MPRTKKSTAKPKKGRANLKKRLQAAGSQGTKCGLCKHPEAVQFLQECLTLIRDDDTVPQISIARLLVVLRESFPDAAPKGPNTLAKHLREHETELFEDVYGQA